jgi:hypothetical protein
VRAEEEREEIIEEVERRIERVFEVEKHGTSISAIEVLSFLRDWIRSRR